MENIIIIILLLISSVSNIVLARRLEELESDVRYARKTIIETSETIRSVENKIVLYLKEK